MTAGRPSKPGTLHILHGTHDSSRHGEKAKAKVKSLRKAPAAKCSVPTPPAWLSPIALTEWRRVTKAMAKLGTIDSTDRVLLAQYCHLYAMLAEEPYTFSAQYHGRLESIQAKLGLCPSARAKLVPAVEPEPEPDDGDPLA